MKQLTRFLILTSLLLLTACGAAEVAPTATATAVSVAAATEVETETPVPPTETAVPATQTPVPEPATATAAPTDAPAETAVPETSATETVEPTAETPEPTAVEPNPTAADPEPTAADAASTSAPPPAVDDGGGVSAPADNNYPGNDDRAGWENRIRVPAGFTVSYVGRIHGNPTSITFGPDGLLYIAVQQGTIVTMDDSGNVNGYFSGLTTPTGIAFRPGTSQLFVSDRPRELNVGGEARVSVIDGGSLRTLIAQLPCCYTFYHSAQGIAFGPDGYGYVGIGGRADHGEILDGPNAGQQDQMHPYEASILRFNPDNGAVEVFARGFRNPYDIAWDPAGLLWVTDNTPDYDPPEEVHRVTPGGQHGYPYYDCDVCFSPPAGVTVQPPTYTFAPSTSPTGIAVYTGNQFPANYYNNKFVTLWSAFVGAQKVMRLGSGAPTNFATGFAAPIDVVEGPDGSLYVADWATGIVFKIRYTG